MEMVRFTTTSIGFHKHLVFIFMILLALGRSFSHARQVKEVKTVNIVTDEKEFAVEGDSNFSLPKEARPDADAVETFAKIGGKELEQGRNSKRVTMAAAHYGEENWKDYFMAFSADYRSPKSHPPKNN